MTIEDIKLVPVEKEHEGPVLFDRNAKPYCLKILDVDGDWVYVRWEVKE